MRSKDPLYIFDARLVERHLKQGVIAEADLREFVQSLPDRAENAEALTIAADQGSPSGSVARNTP